MQFSDSMHVICEVCSFRTVCSKAEAVTANSQSQRIRFLSQDAGNVEAKVSNRASTKPIQSGNSTCVRPLANKVASNIARESKLPEAKRVKTNHASENMIELDIVRSDEES